MRFVVPCSPYAAVLRGFVVLATLLCSMGAPVDGRAQDNSAGLNVGQQAYQMYAENSIESVNVANGNLNLQIPLLSYKQRGSLPPITLEIVANANNWTLTQPGTPGGPGQPTQQQFYELYTGGAAFAVSPFFSGTVLSKTTTSPSAAPYVISEQAVTDASGAVHLMAKTSAALYPNPDIRRSVDATGYESVTILDSAKNVQHAYLLNADGIGIRDGKFSDPNGNAITPTQSTNSTAFSQGTIGPVASYTDSVGRVLPMPTNYGANIPQPGCQTEQYPGPPGSPQLPLTICYDTIPAASPFMNQSVGAAPGTHIVAVTSVTLPNSTQWLFHYNQ